MKESDETVEGCKMAYLYPATEGEAIEASPNDLLYVVLVLEGHCSSKAAINLSLSQVELRETSCKPNDTTNQCKAKATLRSFLDGAERWPRLTPHPPKACANKQLGKLKVGLTCTVA